MRLEKFIQLDYSIENSESHFKINFNPDDNRESLNLIKLRLVIITAVKLMIRTITIVIIILSRHLHV